PRPCRSRSEPSSPGCTGPASRWPRSSTPPAPRPRRPSMPEQSTLEQLEHDPLAAAFAQLRSEVRQELVAPGANAARRTLRRRRTRRVALCAAAAVVAVAGYVGIFSLPHSQDVTPAVDAGAAQRAQALRAIDWPADPRVPWVFSANLPG